MEAVKAAKQSYTPPPRLLNLLEDFRRMVNDCIHIGLSEKLTSLKALSRQSYHQLARYEVATYYRLTAISRAAGILRNYKHALTKNAKTRTPYATKLMLTDCYGFRIVDGKLRLPVRAKEYVYIPLNAYVLRSIADHDARSVTLTPCSVSVTFSKEVGEIKPTGLVGIDSNLDNVTCASSDGAVRTYDLSRATEVRENCREARRGFRRSDHRIGKSIYSKYGRIQRSKVGWILHNASASIVREAKEKRLGVVMEDIRGISKLYRRGNWQSKDYRARLNGWSYAELQRQIEYKARWEGIPVFYVNASKTSSTCAICSCTIAKCSGRKVYCPQCNKVVDRDVNAAMNIVNAGLRFAPLGVAGEAVKGNPRNRGKVIPRVDATQLGLQPKA
jgi:putative transposase